jgi:hypothetical protein
MIFRGRKTEILGRGDAKIFENNGRRWRPALVAAAHRFVRQRIASGSRASSLAITDSISAASATVRASVDRLDQPEIRRSLGTRP